MKEKKRSLVQQWGNAWFALGIASEIGWVIAVPVVSLSLLGKYLDKKFGTDWIFIVVGGVAGIALAVYLVYKRSKMVLKKMKERDIKKKE